MLKAKIVKFKYMNNVHPFKFATDRKMQEDLGAQNRSVLDIHEDLSTKSTKKAASVVELCKNFAAERHDNGTFTDHGHLTLRVGELFVQHMLYERKFVKELGALESGKLSVLNIRDAIPLDKSDADNYANLPRIYDYDRGKTIGAALGSSGWKPSWGGHRGSGETRATIGEGLLNIGEGILNAGSGVLNAGAKAGAGVLNAGAKAGAGILNAGLNAGSSIYNAGLNAGSGIYDWLGAQFGGGTGQGQHGAGGAGGAADSSLSPDDIINLDACSDNAAGCGGSTGGAGGAAGQHGTGRASYGGCTDNSGTCEGSTGQGGVGSNSYSGGSSGHSYSGLNRDINHAQTWTQHYNIQAIEAYISTTDRAALLKSLPKHSDGTIDWPAITQSIGTTIQSEVKATFRDLADMFGVKGKKPDQITLEEIIQKLAEEADDYDDAATLAKEASDAKKEAAVAAEQATKAKEDASAKKDGGAKADASKKAGAAKQASDAKDDATKAEGKATKKAAADTAKAEDASAKKDGADTAKQAADAAKQADDMKADAKQTGDAASAKQQAATEHAAKAKDAAKQADGMKAGQIRDDARKIYEIVKKIYKMVNENGNTPGSEADATKSGGSSSTAGSSTAGSGAAGSDTIGSSIKSGSAGSSNTEANSHNFYAPPTPSEMLAKDLFDSNNNIKSLLLPPELPRYGLYKLNIYHDVYVEEGEVQNHIGHFYIGFVGPDGIEKFFGQNPVITSPIATGKIADEEKRYNEAKGANELTVRSILISKEAFEKAYKYANEVQADPKFYIAHFGYDCIEFVQDIYEHIGLEGDFVDLYSVKELKELDSFAATSARIRYGAGDEDFIVSGNSKKELSMKYNVPLDRIIEVATNVRSSSFEPGTYTNIYTIIPKKYLENEN